MIGAPGRIRSATFFEGAGMMESQETKSRFLNTTTLKIFGILLILFAAIVLLWRGNATSNQAIPALVATMELT